MVKSCCVSARVQIDENSYCYKMLRSNFTRIQSLLAFTRPNASSLWCRCRRSRRHTNSLVRAYVPTLRESTGLSCHSTATSSTPGPSVYDCCSTSTRRSSERPMLGVTASTVPGDDSCLRVRPAAVPELRRRRSSSTDAFYRQSRRISFLGLLSTTFLHEFVVQR